MNLVRDSRLPDTSIGFYQELRGNTDLRVLLRRPDVRKVGAVIEVFSKLDVSNQIGLAEKLERGYSRIPLVALFEDLDSLTNADVDWSQKDGVYFGKEHFSIRRPNSDEMILSTLRTYVLEPSLRLLESIPGTRKPVPIILGIRARS